MIEGSLRKGDKVGEKEREIKGERIDRQIDKQRERKRKREKEERERERERDDVGNNGP